VKNFEVHCVNYEQGSFPKKLLWERRVRVPKAQGSRCGVGRGFYPSPENFFRFWILNGRILV